MVFKSHTDDYDCDHLIYLNSILKKCIGVYEEECVSICQYYPNCTICQNNFSYLDYYKMGCESVHDMMSVMIVEKLLSDIMIEPLRSIVTEYLSA